MALPGGSVLRLYWPVRWSATPHADSAPVHDFSVLGLAFWDNGSGMLVLMIQSALPAVSARVSSKSTRCTVAAAGWAAGPAAAPVGATRQRPLTVVAASSASGTQRGDI